MSGLSLALIGNASERTLRVGEGRRPEAFSMRLGLSRWRLRRTRGAMAFELQFGSQELCEWARKSWISSACDGKFGSNYGYALSRVQQWCSRQIVDGKWVELRQSRLGRFATTVTLLSPIGFLPISRPEFWAKAKARPWEVTPPVGGRSSAGHVDPIGRRALCFSETALCGRLECTSFSIRLQIDRH